MKYIPRTFTPLVERADLRPNAHWCDWAKYRCLMVLGDPGMGKTRELQHQVTNLNAEGVSAVLGEVKEWISVATQLDDILGTPWLEWKRSSSNDSVHVFLDALDEGRLNFEQVLRAIVSQLKGIDRTRVFLRISCRVRDYRETDLSDLHKLYDSEAVKAITLDPLSHENVLAAAIDQLGEIEGSAFCEEISEHRIWDLCTQPLLLSLLLDQYQANGTVGNNRTEVFRAAVPRLLSEHNREYREHGNRETGPARRQEIAAAIAATSLLCGKDEIVLADRDDHFDTARQLECSEIDVGWSNRACLETLDTKLFVSGRRFFHRGLAEYLGAQRLAQTLSAWPIAELAVLPLIIRKHGVPTPVRGLAGWLGTIDGSVRSALLQIDPLTLLDGDVDALPYEDQVLLFESLAAKYQQMSFAGDLGNIAALGKRIEKSVLLDTLLPTTDLYQRLFGMEVVEQAARTDVIDDLLRTLLSPTEPVVLRAALLNAVIEVGTTAQKKYIADLLPIAEEDDPDGELTGIILWNLFPEFVPIERALSSFRKRKVRGALGMSQVFWHRRFFDHIQAVDAGKILMALLPFVETREIVDYDEYDQDQLADSLVDVVLTYLTGTKHQDELTRRALAWVSSWEARSRGKDTRGQISGWLRGRTELKRALLVAYVRDHDSNSEGQFRFWSHPPFPIDALVATDGQWLFEECRRAQSERTRIAYFDVALTLWRSIGFEPVDWFDELGALGDLYVELEKIWISCISAVSVDDRIRALNVRSRRDDADDQKRKAENARLLREGLDKIASNVGNYLLVPASEVYQSDGSDRRGTYKYSSLASEFGDEVVDAVKEGLRRVWRKGELIPLAAKWPLAGGFNWGAQTFLPEMGLELEWEAGEVDWSKAAESQIESALAIAVLLRDDLPVWFASMMEKRGPAVLGIVRRQVSAELEVNEQSPPMCSFVRRASDQYPAIGGSAIESVMSSWPPKNPGALTMIARGVPGTTSALSDKCSELVRRALNEGPDKCQDDALFWCCVGIWWRDNWRACLDFVEAKLLENRDENVQKTSLKRLVSSITSQSWSETWPSDIAQDALIALLPHLFRVLGASDENGANYGWSSPDMSLDILKSSAIERVAGGDPQRAKVVFEHLIEAQSSPQLTSWLRRKISELDRRIIDSTSLPSTAAVVSALTQGKWPVRSDLDFFRVVRHVIGIQLRNEVATAHSVVPLLWTGTKKSGRKPLEEKAFQVAIGNNIALLLRQAPIVCAREPEVFDGKKPDYRLSVALEGGTVVHLPIEMKKSDHEEVWTSPLDQLRDKYMKAADSMYGIYLVGWYGVDYCGPIHPVRKQRAKSALEMEAWLREDVDSALTGSERAIQVFVLDVTV